MIKRIKTARKIDIECDDDTFKQTLLEYENIDQQLDILNKRKEELKSDIIRNTVLNKNIVVCEIFRIKRTPREKPYLLESGFKKLSDDLRKRLYNESVVKNSNYESLEITKIG